MSKTTDLCRRRSSRAAATVVSPRTSPQEVIGRSGPVLSVASDVGGDGEFRGVVVSCAGIFGESTRILALLHVLCHHLIALTKRDKVFATSLVGL